MLIPSLTKDELVIMPSKFGVKSMLSALSVAPSAYVVRERERGGSSNAKVLIKSRLIPK